MSQTLRKIDSNITGLAIAEEASLGKLPDGGVSDVTVSATTSNDAAISALQVEWNEDTSRLTIEATTGPNVDGSNIYMGVIRDVAAGGVTFQTDQGTLIEHQAGIGYESLGNPAGALGEWQPDDIPAAQGVGLSAVVDLTGYLTLGDRFIVLFATTVAGTQDEAGAAATFAAVTITTTGSGTVEWFNFEPNEYSDFGAEITTTERNTINPSRQKQKPVVTDLNASGGFQQDVTQNNMQRLMQGFFFADAREKFTTATITEAYADRITADLTADGQINFSSGVTGQIQVGNLIQVRGAINPANNRVGRVTAINDADTITLTDPGNLVVENSPNIIVEVVGHQLSDGATGITLNQKTMVLTNALDDFDNLGLIPGEWIYIGGDIEEHRFNNNGPGFARVVSVTSDNLTVELVSWTAPQTEAATAGKSIRIFTGMVIKNEDEPDLIKCRTFHIERTLGADSFGTQAEYLKGAVSNEVTMNFSATEKLMADVSFVGIDTELRNGTEGVKGGQHYAPPFEDAYNTSSNIHQMAVYVHDKTAVTPASLFGFVEEGELTINNNVSGLKAIGTLGSFDVNVGNFDVAGELQVYFATVEAVRAVRNNADVGFNVIATKDNGGFVFDIPLLSLGNGRSEVEVDTPIMLPLEQMGARNELGYTMLSTWFAYLPNEAMES